MSPKKKLAKRDISVRHAFIYINILKTDKGLTFTEIAEQLNADNYRTIDGRKYTLDKVSQAWEMGKFKYHIEFINHKKLKVPRSRVKVKNEIPKDSGPTEDTKSELHNPPHSPVKKIYRIELNEAAKELNAKLPLIPCLDTKLSKYKLIKSLIKVILTYDINPKEFTDKTLNLLGSLLFHPYFLKAKKL